MFMALGTLSAWHISALVMLQPCQFTELMQNSLGSSISVPVTLFCTMMPENQ